MAAKGKKQEKAPKSCQECEHWTEVRDKLRVGDVLTSVVTKMKESSRRTNSSLRWPTF